MKRIIKAYDYPIFFAVVLLCLFGLVMIYSSSMITAVARYDQPTDFFYTKQKSALLISFLAMIMTMILPYKIYKNKKFLIFMMFGVTSLLLLLFVFGHTAGNATRWVIIGSKSIQPAEFSKLAMIIYLAAIYGKRQDRINRIDTAVIPPIFILVFICFLIGIQPDYGMAAVIFLISANMIISSGMSFINIFKLSFITLVFVAIFTIGVLVTGKFSSIFSENKVSRLVGFADPFGTAAYDGYQLVNSLFAIGSGGLTGVGFGNSVQKYGYLPESHTDFIMAIIAEELGIFGVSFVLLTLGFIVLRGFVLSAKCKDPFGSLLLIGISSMIGIQVGINVGGVTGLIPISGITLPFISYGGSSLLLLMISMGIYQNIVMRMNMLEQKETANNPIPQNEIPL
ncbi:FtsW/RodA/SpoVE family cell cycle protein [Peribacillus simplex]|uniref:FtsW/RodA/SpoVE family cell cycle protein n=1 Tax=Peribacillus simplex TaxID=1478 RepID=UPI003D2809AE